MFLLFLANSWTLTELTRISRTAPFHYTKSFKARVTLASMATNFLNLSILMDDSATRTIPTTGTTRWSAKRVRISRTYIHFLAHPSIHPSVVWVGPLVVKELKRIVEQSEIIKYALPLHLWQTLVTLSLQGRWRKLAKEKYRREAGVGDSSWKWPHRIRSKRRTFFSSILPFWRFTWLLLQGTVLTSFFFFPRRQRLVR